VVQCSVLHCVAACHCVFQLVHHDCANGAVKSYANIPVYMCICIYTCMYMPLYVYIDVLSMLCRCVCMDLCATVWCSVWQCFVVFYNVL